MNFTENFKRYFILLILASLAGIPILNASSANQTDEKIYLPLTMTTPPFAEALPHSLPPVTAITHAGDERLFIVHRNGLISILHPDQTITDFLDLRSKVVSSGSEQGLFNLAFHPNYAGNGYFYVVYTGVGSGDDDVLRLTRFQVSPDPNIADHQSEQTIVAINMQSPLHNGGGLAFNPYDGRLYLGIGDDQQLLVAQHSNTIKGKLLRIDVDSDSFGARHFWKNAQLFADVEIWAKGLRNPWRFDFEIGSEAIFLTDVGDNRWEEINVILANSPGANFGWPCMEGAYVIIDFGECSNISQFSLPAYSYPRSEGCAIVGGFSHLRTGATLAEREFIFGDICTKKISSLRFSSGSPQVEHLGSLPDEAILFNTFGKDVHGNWYAGTFSSQPIYKLNIPR